MASITLYELSNYNNGRLVPHTFNLDDTPTYEGWLAAVHTWLEQLTRAFGCLCEEWIVAEAEGVPDRYIGEYAIDADYWVYQAELASSHLKKAVFMAAAELAIPPEMTEELYQGEYENDQDFACSMAEDLGLLVEAAQWPYTCVDWKHAARELMYDYAEFSGHYFRSVY